MGLEDWKATQRKWHWSQALRCWSNFCIWKSVEGKALKENKEQSVFPFRVLGQENKQVTVNCKYALTTGDCWWNACMAVHTWWMHYPRLHYMRSPSLHNNRKLRHCTGEGNGTTPVLLPGKSHGQRSLVGYSPWGHKESDTTERLHFLSGSLAGKESACKAGDPGSINSCVGKIPWRRAWQPTPVLLPGESSWTEKPGGLQSTGSQRVGHDWVIKQASQALHTFSI